MHGLGLFDIDLGEAAKAAGVELKPGVAEEAHRLDEVYDLLKQAEAGTQNLLPAPQEQ